MRQSEVKTPEDLAIEMVESLKRQGITEIWLRGIAAWRIYLTTFSSN